MSMEKNDQIRKKRTHEQESKHISERVHGFTSRYRTRSCHGTPPPQSLCPHLCFDHVWFRALHKCDDLVAFSLRDLKSLQSGIEVPQKCRPIAFTDFHPCVGGLHISSCVVQGTACTRTRKSIRSCFSRFTPSSPRCCQKRASRESARKRGNRALATADMAS